jgi:hypothetical protein
MEEPKAVEEGSGESPQAGGISKDSPQNKGGAKVKLAQKFKHKKVNSQRKVGEQIRTIVPAVPKEEEEIKDVGVAKQRRGRPRKAPGTEPPDPRKGSVLDSGKGVCADPVGRDATLGVGGPRPPVGASEHQLSIDKGGEKT